MNSALRADWAGLDLTAPPVVFFLNAVFGILEIDMSTADHLSTRLPATIGEISVTAFQGTKFLFRRKVPGGSFSRRPVGLTAFS